MSGKSNEKIITLGKYLLMVCYTIFILAPFIWILYSSLRWEPNLFAGEFLANPGGLTFNNYFRAIAGANFGEYFLNTLTISFITTAVVTLLALLGGYSLSRFNLRFKNQIIMAMLSSQMFPHVLLIIPFFAVMSGFKLLDSYTGIVLTHIVLGLPFGIWLIKGYFDGVSTSLDDAARIDGLGSVGILFRVVLPVAAPGVAVTAFYAFMVSWGDYLFVSIISQSSSTRTLTIGLDNFLGATQIQWGPINAATVLTVLPTIVLFAFLQKWIVKGLTSGATKG